MAKILTIPNIISFIRLLLIPVFVWLIYGADEVGWAGVLLGVIGATDWIDGFLARRLGQVTELGKFLDPLADRIAVIVAVFIGLATGILPAWFAIALLARETLIVVGAIYGWTHGVTKLDVYKLGKAATLFLYVGITAFFMYEGFHQDWMIVVAYSMGVPGLAMYYWVIGSYFRDMKLAVAAAK